MATSLELVSGDGQSAVSGSALAEPLVVRARDRTGAAVSGVTITFTTSAGSLSAQSVLSDTQGLARGFLFVVEGPIVVTATAPGLPVVTFTATGLPPPPPPPESIGITFSSGDSLRGTTGSIVRFTVTVTHSNPSRLVTLRPLSVPPTCVVAPVTSQLAPASRAASWRVEPGSCGLQRLLFEATDGVLTTRRVLTVSVVAGWEDPVHAGMITGDVTGDGVLDLVLCARLADLGGTNRGAVYVWAGAAAPAGAPTAVLMVSGASDGDQLGSASGQGVQLGDVTGDGVLDVVATASSADLGGTDRGAVYVWAGGPGLSGTLDPTATLRVSSAGNGDRLGDADGQGVLLGDVTGDGTLDIVAASISADAPSADSGAVYLWQGGPGLTGVQDPAATLRVSTAGVNDHLAGGGGAQGLFLGDVSADGIPDVIALAPEASFSRGAVYVWHGGAGLTGTLDPTATLRVSSGSPGDELGFTSGPGLVLGDVTADGVSDLVVGASRADVGGSARGALYVWRGGPGLSGTLDPTASLLVPTAKDLDRLGTYSSGNGTQLADVTGDGVLDVVSGSHEAEVGGAVYVWAGGAGLLGTVAPRATLTVPGAASDARLGLSSGEGVLMADVTGDQTLDVVVITLVPPDLASLRGEAYVWAGGPGLAGSPIPTATLRVSTAADQDQLGNAAGQGVTLGDVTGDGILDLVVGARFANSSRGAIYVWHGGPGLSGMRDPDATLTVSSHQPGDLLPHLTSGTGAPGLGLQLADVSGDGILDVVAGSNLYSTAGMNRGAAYVYRGGPGLLGILDPTATLRVSDAVFGDEIGRASGRGLMLADVVGDDTLDLVVAAQVADLPGVPDAGLVYVYEGGATLIGLQDPTARLRVSTAAPGDQLASASGQGLLLVDVTGDGHLDVVAGTPQALGSAGSAYLWRGPQFTGVLDPVMALTVPGASAGDQLTN